MYKVFGNIIKNPLSIIVVLVLILILLFSLGRVFTSIASVMGFETKENVQHRLTETEKELEKLVNINKENKNSSDKSDELNNKSKDRLDNTLKEIDKIKEEESKAIDKVVSEPSKGITITDSQKKSIKLLMDRDKQFKGRL